MISFLTANRPHYFAKCVNAIRPQYSGQAWLFQDKDEKAPINIKIFKDAFPQSKNNIIVQEKNLGPDMHNAYMYKYMFEKVQSDSLLGLEDDIVVTPIYMQQLELLMKFCQSYPEIVIMSCWGLESRKWDVEKYEQKLNYLTPMHNWCGAVWTKKAYDAIKPYLELYCSIYNKLIYNWSWAKGKEGWIKFNAELKALMEEWGIYNMDCFSVDNFCSNILAMKKLIRVTTTGRYLRHIGVEGSHGINEATIKEGKVNQVIKEHYEIFGKHNIEERLITNFIYDPKDFEWEFKKIGKI